MLTLSLNDSNTILGDVLTARRYFKAKGYYLFKARCKTDTK